MSCVRVRVTIPAVSPSYALGVKMSSGAPSRGLNSRGEQLVDGIVLDDKGDEAIEPPEGRGPHFVVNPRLSGPTPAGGDEVELNQGDALERALAVDADAVNGAGSSEGSACRVFLRVHHVYKCTSKPTPMTSFSVFS